MKKDELHAFLRSRRSIRRFKPDSVPIDCIRRILETAIYAPSAHNLQPWRFVVITNDAAKIRLAESISARYRHDMVIEGIPEAEIYARVNRSILRAGETPVIVILCRDATQIKLESDSIFQKKEALMGSQSVAMAGLQMLLAAHAEGLGGTWICWPLYAPDETIIALGLAKEWEPQGMLFLGYPREAPKLLNRKPLSEVSRFI